ncbi:ArnT family glycosyltransferase [Halosimplex halophilum]|uniref:ArnT family glycosyltransferase n=1 Tax=Halosimplex halophilum TaxID=2559572 RepID=UPI00107FB414|nr:glycosyltransferase family 39 protein [Halosimplex halophilum]
MSLVSAIPIPGGADGGDPGTDRDEGDPEASGDGNSVSGDGGNPESGDSDGPGTDPDRDSSGTDPDRDDPDPGWSPGRLRPRHVHLAGLLAFGVYVYYVGLGGYNLQAWDEGLYANMARHMVQDGYWLVPHLNYLGNAQAAFGPYLKKPPLVPWLQALSMLAFGVTELAARLPSATAAILTGLLTYRIGAERYDRRTGLAAGFALLATPYLFMGPNAGRQATTDAPLLLFGTLFVYLTWLVADRDRPDLLPAVGVAAGLTFLAKGFGAGIFVVVVVPLVLARWRTFVSRGFAACVGITALMAAPWLVTAYTRHGGEFVRIFFVENVIERASGDLFVREGAMFAFMKYPYIRQFGTYTDPWIYYLAPAAVVGVLAVRREVVGDAFAPVDLPSGTGEAVTRIRAALDRYQRPLFLVWWANAVFWFFVFTGNHGWYVMPTFVPIAVLVGHLFALATRWRVAAAGLVAGTAAAVVHSPRAGVYTPLTGRYWGVWGIRPTPDWVVLGVVVVGTALLVGLPRLGSVVDGDWPPDGRLATAAVPTLLCLLLTAGLAAPVALPGSAGDIQQYEAGLATNDAVPEDAVVAVDPVTTRVDHGTLFGFDFYADRTLRAVPRDELADRPDIEYAVVPSGWAERSPRPCEVIARMPAFDVTVLAFGSGQEGCGAATNASAALSPAPGAVPPAPATGAP